MQTKKDKLSILLARTAVFFANCDGIYDSSEKVFIQSFVKNLIEQNHILPETKELIENIKPQGISIEKIVAETKSLISELPLEEKEPFVFSIHSFVKKLITADNKTVEKEQEYLAIWEQEILNL